MDQLKVGQLAARTGLSVRTLHHYDEIGLLTPSARTASGHRLYGRDEVRRLQQVASLRQLGLPLSEIRDCLDRPAFALEGTLRMQVTRLKQDIQAKERLCGLLEGLQRRVHMEEDLSIEELTRTIESTVAMEKYYSPEQLQQFAHRREKLGEEGMGQAQDDWQKLFDAFGDAMEAGIDPASEEVRALAERSAALIEQFTGGNAETRASLSRMYAVEGAENIMSRQGMDMKPGLWEYMGKAAAALKGSEGG